MFYEISNRFNAENCHHSNICLRMYALDIFYNIASLLENAIQSGRLDQIGSIFYGRDEADRSKDSPEKYLLSY